LGCALEGCVAEVDDAHDGCARVAG
jgi:hypothetical protein